jgi:large subunit ribosomal protein L17
VFVAPYLDKKLFDRKENFLKIKKMRHGNKVNNLGRKKAHRAALLRNLGSQLLVHKRIVTTLAKAKALRGFIEPIITKAKNGAVADTAERTHQQRVVFSYLNDKEATKELFTNIAGKVAGRPGGYTRIIKLGQRIGDNAELAMIELVDFNEIYGKGISDAAKPAAKRTRRSSASKKAADSATPAAAATEPKAEEANADETPAAE